MTTPDAGRRSARRRPSRLTLRVRQLFAMAAGLLGPACSFSEDVPVSPTAQSQSLHSLKASSLDGRTVDLSQYKGKVLLVVNTASECGLTPQYAGLETLHEELAPRGFSVLGFPSNDFGKQEPGSADEIREFCSTKYGVTFPLFAKVVTKAGPGQSPVYEMLGGATGKLPGWNFGKYLIGKDGKPVAFYDPKLPPDDKALRADIEKALAAN